MSKLWAVCLLLFTAVPCFAKEPPFQTLDWVDSGTPVLRFTFSKFKMVGGSLGKAHPYVADITAENLSGKRLGAVNLAIYVFDKAHIPYPDGSWSWDFQAHPERGNLDFLTLASKLTHHGAPGGDVYGYAAGDTNWTLNNFVYSQGASYVDDIYHPTTINYCDPKIVNAIQLTQDLAYKYNVSPSSTDLASAGVGSHELFAQGRVAMYVSGIWEVPRFRACRSPPPVACRGAVA